MSHFYHTLRGQVLWWFWPGNSRSIQFHFVFFFRHSYKLTLYITFWSAAFYPLVTLFILLSLFLFYCHSFYSLVTLFNLLSLFLFSCHSFYSLVTLFILLSPFLISCHSFYSLVTLYRTKLKLIMYKCSVRTAQWRHSISVTKTIVTV